MSASLNIERVATHQLSSAQASEVRDLCDAAYGVLTAPFFDSVGPGAHLLGLRAGVLVCHLMWVTRWLQPAGRSPLQTAYVELVATAPTQQRQGYATALLKALPPLLEGFEVAALCPATEQLYLRVGWRFWDGPLFHRRGGQMIPDPEERVMLLPLPRTPHLDWSVPISVEWRAGEVW
jgi:aminoglycoside 2'-N-acetyltransferase I